MIYDRWDVVVIPFPFIEGGESKRRPGLIVSGSNLHQKHGLYWVVMITTAKAGIREEDIAIADVKAVGLSEPRVIRVSRLATLSTPLIQRKIGVLQSKERNAVSALIKRYFS